MSRKGEGFTHCTICRTDFSVEHGGMYDCDRHVKTNSHIRFQENLKHSKTKQVQLGAFFNRRSTDQDFDSLEIATTRAEAMMCDIIAESNLPLAVADKLMKALKLMFPDSKIAQNMKCGRSKATAMIREMSCMHSMELSQRMKKQPFTIATDGSNDVDKKSFPIVVRIQDSNGAVNSELLAVRVCDDAATGQNIFNLVDDELQVRSIPWNNCISFGCDNAAVMTGRHKGVISFIRKEKQEVHMSGCCLHLVHIAAKNGASCLPPVDDMLVDIFQYFKKSVNRQHELKDLQTLYDMQQRKVLKHVSTRWLSIARCVDRLLANWEALRHFFIKEQEKKPGGSTSTYTSCKVDSIALFLKSPTNRLFCQFLSYTLKAFDKVLKGLQADEPMIHALRPYLVELINDLFSRFMLPSAVVGKSVEEVQYAVRANQKADRDLLIGSAASGMIEEADKSHLRSSRIQDFYSAVRKYFQTVCEYLLKKLPLDDPVLLYARVIDPAQQLEAKMSDLKFFLNRFPVLLPEGETKDSILEQFCRYQSADISDCIQGRIDETWAEIATKKDLKGLGRVMAGIMTVPHSSAPCERVFSVVRKNSTEQRPSLGQDTLEALLVIKSKSGHYTDDDRQYTKAQLGQLKSAYHLSLK
eukprot:TRINITY_DN2568_c0_g1_i14.p1 TRINITY_DN2568_c0_g1~~TRINITY_DN2568_c0_g1_i14.p1  ORF type:complete len:672 (-),score=163.69 TRINITY_DN2568_c0_g1_i14:435-2351(-)